MRDRFEGLTWTLLSLGTDTLALTLAGLLAARLGPAVPVAAAPLLAVFSVLVLGRLAATGLHGMRASRVGLLDQARRTAGASALATVGALAAAQLAGGDGQTTGLVLRGAALGSVVVVGGRVLLGLARRRSRLRGRSGKRVLILGAGVIGTQLERRLLGRPQSGLRPVGFLDADPPAADVAGRHGPVLGAPEDLPAAIAATGAKHVIVAFSSAPDSTVQPLLRHCQELGLEVSIVPRLFEEFNDHQWVEHVGGLPLYGLRRVDPKSWHFVAKHALDRLLAALLLALVGPLLAALALAVRGSSPGPVLFRQRRVGRDGRAFDILKFRTMRIAQAAQADSAFRPTVGHAPGGVEGDDRRTAIGALLRRTSLDELPQLLNVVRGEMSLVGPRPERPEFVELFARDVRRYGERHRVKSGMTGWAQVHGLRGQTSLAERVEWDNWYILNWSLWLDVKILLLTPLAVLRSPVEPPPPPRAVESPALERATA